MGMEKRRVAIIIYGMKFKCPICGKMVKPKTDEKGGFFPFCSERCKLVDLNEWFEEGYTISSPVPETDEEEGEGENSKNKVD